MTPTSPHFTTWTKMPKMFNVTPCTCILHWCLNEDYKNASPHQECKSTSRLPFRTGPMSHRWKGGWGKRVWFFHLSYRKLPQSILWTPLCLCPCAKRSQLPRLAHSLAKYWRLPVETQPVKTVREEKALDESWAKNITSRGGGFQTHPDLPTGPVEERMDRTSEKKIGLLIQEKGKGRTTKVWV